MTTPSSTNPVRIGVIGLGYAGEESLKGYQKLPNVEIVALAGLEEDRLHQLGQTFNIPHLYREYQDLLARDDIDAVSIAVPNSLHAPIAIAALDRGMHVLVEKPLACTGDEAKTMVQAAIKANRILQTVFNRRERDDIQRLKQYIDEIGLGKIYYAKAYWIRRRGIPAAGSWFVNKRLAGGGPLIDLGVHVLDTVLFLLNEPEVITVSASTYNELGSRGIGTSNYVSRFSAGGTINEVEDFASAFMRLSTGATLTLEASWATHSSYDDDYGIILYGSEGGAEVKAKRNTLTDTLRIYTNVAGVPAEVAPKVQGGEFHAAVTRQFVERITSGNWSLHQGHDGLRRARIIDACYASAQHGREVVLDREEL
ncbi:MAG TPA: Gfo/Idh/MocA family oxidoreductase [Ktedonobacteraceae bacterium]|jgi:predicted dehydrogenase|nr:Gfo/Idh/MocA family oxidoreductase [Ktedonobacteraceae bacterium]